MALRHKDIQGLLLKPHVAVLTLGFLSMPGTSVFITKMQMEKTSIVKLGDLFSPTGSWQIEVMPMNPLSHLVRDLIGLEVGGGGIHSSWD